jgi:enoyl-CoA hydratase/carnithine racemase
MSDRIVLTRADDVATIELRRPEAHNAIDGAMRRELTTVLRALDVDPCARAVVLVGAGERAFTAGQDLAELAEFDADDGERWMGELGALYQAIRDLGKPCVVAVNLVAAGAGLQIALHADVRIGHPGIRMSQPEINAALPSVLGSWILRNALGLARAQVLGLSGRPVDGDTCLRYGLVDMLVPAELVLEDAQRTARRLAGKPPLAVRLTKRRLRDVTQASWEAAIAAGRALARQAFSTGEPQRVAAAFLARRRDRAGV